MNFEAMPTKKIDPWERKISPMKGEKIPADKLEQANARLAMEHGNESPVHEITPTGEETILEGMSPEDRGELETLREEINDLNITVEEKSPILLLGNIFVGRKEEILGNLKKKIEEYNKAEEPNLEELEYCLRRAIRARSEINDITFKKGINLLIQNLVDIALIKKKVDFRNLVIEFGGKDKIKQAA